MMGYYNGDWGVGEWLAMSAMMLLFWGSVIGLVVWVSQNLRGESRQADSSAGPDEVLAERYARGDIDEDEFRRRRELLQTTR